MRGEYLYGLPVIHRCTELPPRARRILQYRHHHRLNHGTTSACAENTGGHTTGKIDYGNYLRVRGEYLIESRVTRAKQELPPRARRIQTPKHHSTQSKGTTSACAENTALCPPRCRGRRNYLRVRGEYKMAKFTTRNNRELPPRARRILGDPPVAGDPPGTTSACAENT